MANVHDNSMTAHEWAHGNGETRSHNANMFADGATLFSYGRHFPLAVRIPRDGAPLFVLNGDTYSITTTRHQSCVRQAVYGETVTVPDLEPIWRQLDNAARGIATARDAVHVREYLERAHAASGMDRHAIATLLRVVGSRAKASSVEARSVKAAEREKAEREKRTAATLLNVARKVLERPLSAFDGTGATPFASEFNAYGVEEIPTKINRAWKVAKAKGWSKKRLDALRQREKALRANLERVTRRQRRESGNHNTRRALASLRQSCAGRPVLEAYESGSLDLRQSIARAVMVLLCNRVSTLSTPSRRWQELEHHTAQGADKAKQLQRHVKRQHAAHVEANALEMWREGENVPSQLIRNAAQGRDLVRAVNVKRDDSGAITGGELQTSGGARVPLTHAVRLFRFLKLVRSRFEQARPGADGRVEEAWSRNGERARVGSFEVDHINGDGSFKAGCHYVEWNESRDLAEALGVFDAAPSDDLVKAHEPA